MDCGVFLVRPRDSLFRWNDTFFPLGSPPLSLFEGEEFSVVRNGIGRHNWKPWGIQLDTGEGRAGIGQEGPTEVGLSSLDSDAKLWTI